MPAKSISHETTFEQDIDEPEVLRAWLPELTEQVGWRLRRHRLSGRTVHLKVRFADFSLITRSQTLTEPTSITQELWQASEPFLFPTANSIFLHRPSGNLGWGQAGNDPLATSRVL